MPDIQDNKPLLIKVNAFSWEAITEGEPTEREKFLANEIKIAGGIDLTVPPGMYLFNVSKEGNHVALIPYKHQKKLF